MRTIFTEIPNLLLLEPDCNRDRRGFFMETWREEWRAELGLEHHFIQDNHARSEDPGVLRGLHFQRPPHAQGKLVWVVRGSVFDVAVDLRVGSPTYGTFFGRMLSAENALRMYVPRGFAHGYVTLEPGTEFCYKVDAYYNPEAEGGLCWNDPDLDIPWPDISPILSEKDARLPLLRELESPFTWNGKH